MVQEAVTEVLLNGEVCDQPRLVAAFGAVVSIAILLEHAETVLFAAVSMLVIL